MKRFEPPGKQRIDGVVVKDLKVIPDERGRLMEILRADDEIFAGFGQVYMTTNYPGVIKAWHYHKNQDDHVVCVRGMIKLVMYDPREGSPTKGLINEFFLGDHNHQLVRIPRNVWHGWKCIATVESLIINIPTATFNYQSPDEYRLPYDTDEIPYDWGIKMG